MGLETPIRNVLRDVTQLSVPCFGFGVWLPKLRTTLLCCGKKRRVSGSTHLVCATVLLLDGDFTFK